MNYRQGIVVGVVSLALWTAAIVVLAALVRMIT